MTFFHFYIFIFVATNQVAGGDDLLVCHWQKRQQKTVKKRVLKGLKSISCTLATVKIHFVETLKALCAIVMYLIDHLCNEKGNKAGSCSRSRLCAFPPTPPLSLNVLLQHSRTDGTRDEASGDIVILTDSCSASLCYCFIHLGDLTYTVYK